MSHNVHDFVLALAAPVMRYAGELPRGLDVTSDETAIAHARRMLEVLFGANETQTVESLLDFFRDHGQRAEFEQYRYHLTQGWKPSDRDPAVPRKADFVREHTEVLGKNALLGWDAARAAAIAIWAIEAKFLGLTEASQRLVPLLEKTRNRFADWRTFAIDYLAGRSFFFGSEDLTLRAIVEDLLATGAHGWNVWPASPIKRGKGDAKQTATQEKAGKKGSPKGPVSLCIALSIDCHGCGLATHAEDLVTELVCMHCGTSHGFGLKDWSYLFRDEVNAFVEEANASRPPERTNDFGVRFFSRRVVERGAPRCPWCEAPFAWDAIVPRGAGSFVCDACQRAYTVRSTTAVMRAIHPHLRWAVARAATEADPPRQPVRMPCLACRAAVIVDGRDALVPCPTCHAPNVVPDPLWHALRRSVRRGWVYLLVEPPA